jgi:DNA-binding MarR family transcriptional regulator
MTQPQVEDLAAILFEAMARYMRAIVLSLPTEAAGAGAVTKEQWGALGEVDKDGADGISMGELAARRGMALNSATALVDRLVNAGLLERRHDENDRRVVRVRVTAEGLSLRKAISGVRRAKYDRLLGQLSQADLERLHAAVPALSRLADVAARIE